MMVQGAGDGSVEQGEASSVPARRPSPRKR